MNSFARTAKSGQLHQEIMPDRTYHSPFSAVDRRVKIYHKYASFCHIFFLGMYAENGTVQRATGHRQSAYATHAPMMDIAKKVSFFLMNLLKYFITHLIISARYLSAK